MIGFKKKHDDILHNRRLLAVLCFLLFISWGVLILICTILYNFDAGKASVFLGFIGILSSTGIIGYLHAAHKEGKKDGK